jgi:hypothetical protein
MGKATDLKLLFKALIEQFGFGQISSFKASNITTRIPKYKNVKVAKPDLAERKFYSGKYSGYSDEELMEVLDTNLFAPDLRRSSLFTDFNEGREDSIENGKLIQHREVDGRFDLPPGTSRRLLSKVVRRYHLRPVFEGENVVRFGHEERAV